MKVADLFAKLSIQPDRRSFSAADKLLGAVKGALLGITAVKTVGFFKDIISDVSKTADDFNKLAKKVGISSESLQQLEYVAKLSGANIDVVRTGLQRFARTMDDAVNNKSKMAGRVLKRLGVDAKNPDGSLKNLDETLMDVADRFSKMPDGTEKTALAMQAFGRSGAELIPFLNEGRGGITKLREEFVKLGGQIDTKTGKAFEQFNDDQERLHTVWKGLKIQLATQLLPHLQKVVTTMLDWIKVPRNMEKVRAVVKKIADAIAALFKIFFKVTKYIYDNFERLSRIAKSVGKALAVVWAVGKAKAFVGVLMSVLSPFNVIVGAVMLIAKLLAKAFDVDVLTVFEASIAAIGAVIEKVVEGYKAIYDLAREIKDVFAGGRDTRDVVRAKKRFKGRSDAEVQALTNDPLLGEDAKTELDRRNKDFARAQKARAQKEAAGLRSTPDIEGYKRAQGAKGLSVNAPMNLTVNAPSGDGAEIAGKLRQTLNKFWDERTREMAAALND